MALRLVPVEEQKQIIPDSAIRTSFMSRDDIAGLDEPERERLWAQHLITVNQLREFFSNIPSVVIE